MKELLIRARYFSMCLVADVGASGVKIKQTPVTSRRRDATRLQWE